MDRAEKIALFVDIESFIGFSAELSLPIDLAPVIGRLTEIGKVSFRRSFGDLTQTLYALAQSNRLNHIRQMLQRNLVQHEDVPYQNIYKNSSDIRLVVEALSVAFNSPDVTKFAVVARDRDYIPLFSKLRELGKDVVGVTGNRTIVRDTYLTSCDVIIYVEDLYKAESALTADEAGKSSVAEALSESYLQEEYCKLLVRAVSSLSEQGKTTVGSAVVPLMRQLQPDFDFGRAGLQSLRDLVPIAEEKGLIISKAHGADLLVTLRSPAAADAPAQSAFGADGSGSVEEYRSFIEGKLRCPLPSRDLRRSIYKTAEKVLDMSDGAISLNDLSHDVIDSLIEANIPVTQSMVFKLLYSLYRARCFVVEDGMSGYDPRIVKTPYRAEDWDEKFIWNALFLMRRELYDVPFVARNLSVLFYENEGDVNSITRMLENLSVEYVTG